MTLSIVIVNYNVKHFLEQTLTSVFKALGGIDSEVFVVDNNSVDGSCELVERKFPEAKLIANKDNPGFSKANNQAIKLAKGKYVLLLNPDTVVEEDTFVKCIEFMDSHTDCGGLGVKMVDGSGKFLPESKRGLPTPWVAFYKIFGLSKLLPKSKRFGKYHLTYLSPEETHEIEVLSGAFMFMRMEALDKSGLLDEDFFMYGEDIDLSYRLIKAGYKNYYYPDTRIIHYKGESTKKSSVNYVFVFYNAMIIFARKHFSSSGAGIYTVLIKMAIYLRAGMSVFTRLIKKISWPLLDASSIFLGMYFLKTYWENNHKWVPETKYPPEYILIAVPIYIVIWLFSIYFSGGYDRPFKPVKVVRGVIFGALVISAGSNFIDAFRFSKALIVLGSTYAIFSLVFSRFVWHLIRYKNLSIGELPNRRVALVGRSAETSRVKEVLSKGSISVEVLGTIILMDESSNENEVKGTQDLAWSDDSILGKIEDLKELVNIYKLNELIFCAKDIPAGQIIGWMTAIDKKDIEFKIVPDDSNFIIGSSSKDSQGDYYALDVELNITKKENIRKKRLIDLMISLGIIGMFPLVLFTRRKFRNITDAFSVLFGIRTWVGFSSNATASLPSLKEGVFSPTSKIQESLDVNATNRINLLYAKDYNTQADLEIVLGVI